MYSAKKSLRIKVSMIKSKLTNQILHTIIVNLNDICI